MSKENSSRGGLTFLGALQIALIVLKLCGVIACSWFVTLLPIVIFVGIPLAVLLIILIFAFITGIKITD
jgi:hypothetical protein